MKIKFIKMQAGGNDFILTDNRKGLIKNRKGIAKKLCRRKFSIGADGLLFLEDSRKADFRMRIYNLDGTEAEMCGNGIRCLIKFICLKKLYPHLFPPLSRQDSGGQARGRYYRRRGKRKISIETGDGVYQGEVKENESVVKMKESKKIRLNLKLKIKGKKEKICFIKIGVPHAILFVDNLEKVDVKNLGSSIRYHKQFSPRGTNVDFVKMTNCHSLKIRTYERGVEDETFSCGTGAAAAAVLAYKLGKVKSPVKIFPAFGEPLKVYFDPGLKKIYLAGKVTKVYEGDVEI